MFSSWIPKNKAKQQLDDPTKTNHFILNSKLKSPLGNNEEEILFGCGCFWGAEKGFWRLPGVTTTAVGYSGGNKKNPTYKEVCSGQTGHTEVVRVVWNNKLIDVSDLLKLFWECHDPTQGNRQGNDIGTQYRSAIFTKSKANYEKAISSRDYYQKDLTDNGYKKITTEIADNIDFYFGENYHQQYLAKPGARPYCSSMPTNIKLGNFPGSNYKLNKDIWLNFNWEIQHCILRSNNEPIQQ